VSDRRYELHTSTYRYTKDKKFMHYVSVTVGNILTRLFTHEKITNSLGSTFRVSAPVSVDFDVTGSSKRVHYVRMSKGLWLIGAAARKKSCNEARSIPSLSSSIITDNNPYNLPI
jgi:hypothetical protein